MISGMTGKELAAHYGVEKSLTQLSPEAINAGEFFISKNGALYLVVSWGEPDNLGGQGVSLRQWKSGDVADVKSNPEPDTAGICVAIDDHTFRLGEESVYLINPFAADVQEPESEQEPARVAALETLTPVEIGEEQVGVEVGEFLGEEVNEDPATPVSIPPEDLTKLQEEGAIAQDESAVWQGTKKDWLAVVLGDVAPGAEINVEALIEPAVAGGVWDDEGKAARGLDNAVRKYCKEHPDYGLVGKVISREGGEVPPVSQQKVEEAVGYDDGTPTIQGELVIRVPIPDATLLGIQEALVGSVGAILGAEPEEEE